MTPSPRARGAGGARRASAAVRVRRRRSSFGAVVAALVSQHAYGMEPCPWCVLQRLIFVAIGVFALLGLVWRGAAGSRVAAHLRAPPRRRAASRAALWQHFVAARVGVVQPHPGRPHRQRDQLDRLLPDVFEARASCADAAVNLLGVPYAIWSALAFVVCAIALLRILRASA